MLDSSAIRAAMALHVHHVIGAACGCGQAPMIAVGFRITVAKWLVLVRLLRWEIPERLELTTPGLARALQPYFRLTMAVRGGDLSAFRCAAREEVDGACPVWLSAAHSRLNIGHTVTAYSWLGTWGRGLLHIGFGMRS